MIEFKVDDMTCGHCAGVITKAVAAVDAKAKVAIDIPNRTVRIDGSSRQQAIQDAITEAGYTPVLVA
ncbi:copper chaperone [Sulfuriferula multivorans]|uniref:Copper chaperone n=1 Tax=Sulfuriferula multivorans TaxID=1559896 RepID=A0A401JGX4_9PROT|nr:heavy-metal-associated domain-containing protein [Sulfuriferula multivorans]GBL46889.1 copper chaperone [Sulfuriferula multivorans]